jgi:PAS domain S-box-containing protein
MEINRQPAATETRERHLIAVLRGIRGVSRLIVAEDDPGRLIERACESLTATMGYHNAWIALLGGEAGRTLGLPDQGAVSATAAAGFDGGFGALRERLARGGFPACMGRALETGDTLVTRDPATGCPDCPLSADYGGRAGLTRRLEFDGVTYGVLTASVPAGYARDSEEQELFDELAGDLAFGLHRIATSRRMEASEARIALLGQMLDEAPAAITIHDTAGRFLFSNRRNMLLHGYASEQEFLTVELPDLDVPESAALIEERMRIIAERGEACFEVAHRRKDGTVFPLEVLVRRLVWEGRPALLSVATDITGRKAMEAELAASEQRFRAAFDSASIGRALTLPDGRLARVNTALGGMLGYSPAELEERNFAAITHPDDRDESRECVRCLLAGEQDTYRLEKRYLHRDGAFVWTEVNTTLLRDEHGEPLNFVTDIIDITDRKRAEEALLAANQQLRAAEQQLRASNLQLRESEERFRQVYEHMAVGVARVSLDMRIEQANEAYCQMLGYAEEQLVGMHLRDLTRPGLLEENLREQSRLVSGEIDHFEMEKAFVHKDGHVVHGILDACLVRTDRGEPAYCLGSVVDITERRRAEEERRQADSRFRIAQEMSPDGFTILRPVRDASGRVVDFVWLYENAAVARLNGTDPEKVVGRRLLELFPGHRGTSFLGAYQRVAETGEQATFEDGYSGDSMSRPTWFRIVVVPMDGDIAVLAQDITERKRAEEDILAANQQLRAAEQQLRASNLQLAASEAALRLSEEKYRTLVEGSLQGVVIAQAGPVRLSFANQAMEGLSGYAVDELLGMGPAELAGLIHPEDRERFFDNFQRRVAKEALPPTAEYRILRKDGDVTWALCHSGAIDYLGEPATLTTFIDISQVKRAEREHSKLRNQLQESQKLESIGRLAGGVAHDFNNLLSVIISYADFAATALRESDPARADVLEIRKAGERAATLTRQLLAFSRRQVLEPRLVDLNGIVGDIEGMLRRLLGEDIEIAFHPAAGLGSVLADPGQLEQVLVNLAVNARDAMPAGGRLTIETAHVELDEDYAARHAAVLPGRYVLLSVTDTGCGMDAKVRERLFEPFFTTKEVGKGTGLGLATCYGIVKQSGGNIRVYSEPGQGTTFKIYLPRVDAPAAGVTRRSPVTVARGTETVLLVEDEEAVRGLAERILRSAGYEVLAAGSGAAALALFEEHGSEVDLLLTDVVMPRVSGRELAERLATLRPGLRVLYMSGYADDAIVQHGVLDPGTRFIGKPFSSADLTRKVREVLDGSGEG